MSRINGEEKLPFYKEERSYVLTGIASLVGCASMIFGTLFNWISLYTKTTEVSKGGISILKTVKNALDGMFPRDLQNHITKVHFSVNGILTVLFIIIFYLAVIFLGIAGIKDNLRHEDFFSKRKKTVRLAVLVLLIVLIILLTHTFSFNNSMNQFEGAASNVRSFIDSALKNHVEGADDMVCRLYHGLGTWCFWIGIVIYFASLCVNFVLDTLNEE